MSVACLCGLACCAGAITYIAFLGKYAFANPNLEAWYGVVAEQQALFPTEALGAAAGDSLVDVHGKMVTWFLWGFIQALLPCVGSLLAVLCGLISPVLASVMGGLSGCGIAIGGLSWYIAGLVWRFNAAGKYASGDLPEGFNAV